MALQGIKIGDNIIVEIPTGFYVNGAQLSKTKPVLYSYDVNDNIEVVRKIVLHQKFYRNIENDKLIPIEEYNNNYGHIKIKELKDTLSLVEKLEFQREARKYEPSDVRVPVESSSTIDIEYHDIENTDYAEPIISRDWFDHCRKNEMMYIFHKRKYITDLLKEAIKEYGCDPETALKYDRSDKLISPKISLIDTKGSELEVFDYTFRAEDKMLSDTVVKFSEIDSIKENLKRRYCETFKIRILRAFPKKLVSEITNTFIVTELSYILESLRKLDPKQKDSSLLNRVYKKTKDLMQNVLDGNYTE